MHFFRRRVIACALLLAGAGCTSLPPPTTAPLPLPSGCSTSRAAIFFDFEGAPPSRCTIADDGTFSVVIAPEHAPPINPSPWYALRFETIGDAPVTVRLQYFGAEHRYIPKLSDGAGTRTLPVEISDDRKTASFTLPGSSQGVVSAQPLLGLAYYSKQLSRLAAIEHATRLELGKSHEGKAIEALHYGDKDAPELIILLGRQHPPEVTGAYAFESFMEEVIALLRNDLATAKRFQILAVPLLNPDGVVRGHWRANLGGVDLNRDWGKFTQPETAAVKRWLDNLPPTTRPAVMIDFHSTQRNLFYVQGEEVNAAQRNFLSLWLEGKENRFAGFPFTIERRQANPGSGTAKNWFHSTYSIPSYTYEVGDTTEIAATRLAAKALASDLIDVLK